MRYRTLLGRACSPDEFREEFASVLREYIQELVGHSTLSMTLRYMHLAPSAHREAIGLLDFDAWPAPT
jgi:integrase